MQPVAALRSALTSDLTSPLYTDASVKIKPAARAGFHQLVARKGGTHVGLGLPGLRGGARRGWVARPPTTPFPSPPRSHTHISLQHYLV